MKIERESLLHASGLIPLLTLPWLGTTWLIFTIFALLHRIRERVWRSNWFNGSSPRYILAGMASAYLTEILAIIDNLKLPPGDRILLNPYPLTDLYLALAYYFPFILYWGLLVRRYDYSWKDVIIIGGTSGIFMEQTGAVFLSMNPLAWLYVFLVYGSYKAIPVLLHWKGLERMERKRLQGWKKALLGFSVEALAFVSAGLLLWIFSKAAGLR